MQARSGVAWWGIPSLTKGLDPADPEALQTMNPVHNLSKAATLAALPWLMWLGSHVEGNTIFEFHRDFHFLLADGQALFEIPPRIDKITPQLELEVEIFAAADIRASADLLYTSVSMLLHHHAALVEVFSETQFFSSAHILPSIELLLNNTEKVKLKCKRYLTVVKRPELFQQILNLDSLARNIESNLAKYRPVTNPSHGTEPVLKEGSPTEVEAVPAPRE
jgi:hypothetical protein